MTSSNRNKKHETIPQLQKRGIRLENGTIKASTNGLAWISNFIHDTGGRGKVLTPRMLKALSEWKPVGNIRELRIVVTCLPTWEEGIIYYRITAYLNLTPTGLTVLDFPLTASIRSESVIDGMTDFLGASPFKVEYHSPFRLCLSDEEVETLRCGGMIRIHPTLCDA